MGLWYGVCAIVTLASALTSFAFSMAEVRQSDGRGHMNALYGLSRSAALVVVCAVPLVYLSDAWLTAAAIAMILVQGGDMLVGRVKRDSMKTFGPAALALANLGALVLFVTQG